MIGGVVGVAQDVVEMMFFPCRDMGVRGVRYGGDGAGGSEEGEVGLSVRNVCAVES